MPPKKRKAPRDSSTMNQQTTGQVPKKTKAPNKNQTKPKKPPKTSRSQKYYQAGNTGGTGPPSGITPNLSKMFDQYRENAKESPNTIGIEGASKYLEDLDVKLDEVAHLALCEMLQCPSIGEFDRDAFVSGWRNASTTDNPCDTIDRQAKYISSLRAKLGTDPTYFKQVYRNSFKLAKPESQRSIPLDSALEFWTMFFGEGKGSLQWNTSSTKWLDIWLEYYQTKNKRPVNKDLWNMTGELVMKTKEPGGENLEWWSEEGAWPMAVDDFVKIIKDKRAAGGDTMDTS